MWLTPAPQRNTFRHVIHCPRKALQPFGDSGFHRSRCHTIDANAVDAKVDSSSTYKVEHSCLRSVIGIVAWVTTKSRGGGCCQNDPGSVLLHHFCCMADAMHYPGDVDGHDSFKLLHCARIFPRQSSDHSRIQHRNRESTKMLHSGFN
ncbi:unannotated protein [freshwater metagenome]|uniref:Unannotated protein n=1 Tax=freshwater metagenome TaxID=449393 RepID=A0A6J7UMT4_9ZZZZ